LKTFTVWHRIVPTFMDNTEDTLTEFPRGFIEVAIVKCGDLNDVFQLTNHIDHDWTKNPEVTKVITGGVRSTSVGDVIEAPTGLFSIEGVGFKEFGRHATI